MENNRENIKHEIQANEKQQFEEEKKLVYKIEELSGVTSEYTNARCFRNVEYYSDFIACKNILLFQSRRCEYTAMIRAAELVDLCIEDKWFMKAIECCKMIKLDEIFSQYDIAGKLKKIIEGCIEEDITLINGNYTFEIILCCIEILQRCDINDEYAITKLKENIRLLLEKHDYYTIYTICKLLIARRTNHCINKLNLMFLSFTNRDDIENNFKEILNFIDFLLTNNYVCDKINIHNNNK